MSETFDVAVIGGGMVGGAIAYGCASGGARCVLLDGADASLRAARGNFGLVWLQGKGKDMPAYAVWTRLSLEHWPAFAEAMGSAAGQPIGYRRAGGLDFCVGEQEFAERRDELHRLHNLDGGRGPPLRLLDRQELEELLPNTPLGPAITGASLAPDDGHVNPLLLLRGLHAGYRRAGGVHRPGVEVRHIDAGDGFLIDLGQETVRARKVVVAAGVGTQRLAAMVGIDAPVRPVRGQNMVTERLPPMLPLPASAIRQTEEGVVQIGVTNEEGTWEPATTVEALARMAARAVTVLPPLGRARIVRAWGALRPMTPDGYPCYAQSTTHPGAFVAVCHSGVTLSAVHANVLAPMILAGRLSDDVSQMHPSRFVRGAHVHPA
jgi:glycine/D-amino acid oxidase-like deaminating enzyme